MIQVHLHHKYNVPDIIGTSEYKIFRILLVLLMAPPFLEIYQNLYVCQKIYSEYINILSNRN